MLAYSMQTNAVSGAPLVWLRLEGLAVLGLSILLYRYSGASWWRFALLLLTPDLTMAGYWLGSRYGSVLYNLAHSYAGPLLLAALTVMRPDWLPYVLIWTAHIGMDRALGYGLKYPSGFGETHLGRLGAGAKV
jgi:hypothetical protein